MIVAVMGVDHMQNGAKSDRISLTRHILEALASLVRGLYRERLNKSAGGELA